MATKEVKGNFELPNEIVTVKFIPRKRGMAAHVSDDHVISGGMLSETVKKFSAPLQKNGKIANILTNEEKEYIEGVTGLDLSVYGEFWQTYMVRLFKEEANNIFDTSDVMDFISVRLLETLEDDIAKSWNERDDKASYQFVITRGDEITDEKKVKLDIKKEAFKLYGKIEDDKDKLLSILKLLSNKPISKDSKLKWVQGQVEEYVDNQPKSFVDIVNDPSFDTKVLISKGVETGVIIRKSNKYTTIDGLELSENGEIPSYPNAVTYLEQDKNQDVRSLIEAKIDNAK